MSQQTTDRTVGDNAREFHRSVINLVTGRGLIACDVLKDTVARITGSNVIASVVIDQLEREGRIERTKSGKSWRASKSGPGRPEIGPHVSVRMPQELIDRIDELAARNLASRAEIIRSMLWQQLYTESTGRAYAERVDAGMGTDEEEEI